MLAIISFNISNSTDPDEVAAYLALGYKTFFMLNSSEHRISTANEK